MAAPGGLVAVTVTAHGRGLDVDAFDALYAGSFKRLVAQIYAMCGNFAEAQDCVQEAFVRAAAAETSLPAFALGGIGPENIADVVAAGARRVAVSSAITQAADPEPVARVLRAALDG